MGCPKIKFSAQPGTADQDIGITHKRSGIELTVESKSAVRGSFTAGKRSRNIKQPHFKVKCHRSRSNVKLAGTTNDRYHVSSFDIVITNNLNAIYVGNTISEFFELPEGEELDILYKHYNVDNSQDLQDAAANDYRFALAKHIAEDDYIPRTPYVLLEGDQNWKPLSKLPNFALEIVSEKRQKKAKPRT